jgi:hypothetical protein
MISLRLEINQSKIYGSERILSYGWEVVEEYWFVDSSVKKL